MPQSAHAELLILGCGPAGYSAAVHAARANLRPLLIAASAHGTAHPRSNPQSHRTEAMATAGAADLDMIPGPELKQRLRDHAERANTRVVFDQIKWVNLARRPFHVQGHCGHYTCDAVIVAVEQSEAASLFQGQLEIEDGQIVTYTGLSGMATLTSLQGVFVAGEVRDPALGDVVTSTGTGCLAVLDAQRFLGI